MGSTEATRPPVLVSASTFPTALDDGLPRFVFDLAAALARRYPVTVLAPHAPGVARFERMNGLPVQRFAYWPWPLRQRLAYGHGMRQNMRASLEARLQVLPYVIALARATRAQVDRNGIALVNTHWVVPQGLGTALARNRTRFRHVLSVHAGDVYLLQRIPGGRALLRFILERTDRVLADGSHVAAALDELLGKPAHAHIQPMGVHVDQFAATGVAPPSHPFPAGYLVFVGRFVEKKGLRYLIEALAVIRERKPGLGLVLIGYGELESAIRAQVTRLQLDDAVLFTGKLPHRDLIPWLHHARLAAVPSVIDANGETDGMPTVVSEAMAAGLPVVGSAVDGIPDVIRDGHNGWLCPEKDAAALAATILGALDDPDAGARIEAARQTARGLDWEAVSAQYAAIFDELLGG